MRAVIRDEEKTIGEIILGEKDFKTGSRGFHGFGKITIDGRKYQANFMLVEIGSKPDAKRE